MGLLRSLVVCQSKYENHLQMCERTNDLNLQILKLDTPTKNFTNVGQPWQMVVFYNCSILCQVSLHEVFLTLLTPN